MGLLADASYFSCGWGLIPTGEVLASSGVNGIDYLHFEATALLLLQTTTFTRPVYIGIAATGSPFLRTRESRLTIISVSIHAAAGNF